MKTLKHLSRLTLLLLFIGATSCSNDDNGPTPPMEEDANIVEAAQATSDASFRPIQLWNPIILLLKPIVYTSDAEILRVGC